MFTRWVGEAGAGSEVGANRVCVCGGGGGHLKR
jgi:hypothetical protein